LSKGNYLVAEKNNVYFPSPLFGFFDFFYFLDHVVIDANGLIIWEIVGSCVIDANGLILID
jgi:hypothetical protein